MGREKWRKMRRFRRRIRVEENNTRERERERGGGRTRSLYKISNECGETWGEKGRGIKERNSQSRNYDITA